MSVSANAVSVPAGTYLITYHVSATLPAANDVLTVELLENTTPISTSSAEVSTANAPATVTGTVIRTEASPTTYSLENASTVTATVTDAGITVLKLA
jgi:hypothetical protein